MTNSLRQYNCCITVWRKKFNLDFVARWPNHFAELPNYRVDGKNVVRRYARFWLRRNGNVLVGTYTYTITNIRALGNDSLCIDIRVGYHRVRFRTGEKESGATKMPLLTCTWIQLCQRHYVGKNRRTGRRLIVLHKQVSIRRKELKTYFMPIFRSFYFDQSFILAGFD